MTEAERAREPDRFVDVADARLRVRDEGAGPAILFLHGWALDLEMWDPQVAVFAPHYRVIRFDRRGFGLSTGEPSIERDVEDVRSLLDHLQVDRAALVGMSQGARVALRAALTYPERVACIVLDGPPEEVLARRSAGEEIPLDLYRVCARQGLLDGVRGAWACHPYAQLRTGEPAARRLLSAMIARYPGRDLLSAQSVRTPALADTVRLVSVQALVVNGADDSAVRLAAGARLADTIPRARRALVPDAGHLPNLDHPALYNAELTRFLTETLHAEH